MTHAPESQAKLRWSGQPSIPAIVSAPSWVTESRHSMQVRLASQKRQGPLRHTCVKHWLSLLQSAEQTQSKP